MARKKLRQYRLAARWLSRTQMCAKYSLDIRTLNKWINGQGRDCYRLQVIKTPSGLRILDPQLEFPPHRTAPPDELYIYSSRDVANLLGITTRGVRWMADNELVRFRQYGRERFYPLSEIRRLMRDRKSPANLQD